MSPLCAPTTLPAQDSQLVPHEYIKTLFPCGLNPPRSAVFFCGLKPFRSAVSSNPLPSPSPPPPPPPPSLPDRVPGCQCGPDAFPPTPQPLGRAEGDVLLPAWPQAGTQSPRGQVPDGHAQTELPSNYTRLCGTQLGCFCPILSPILQ